MELSKMLLLAPIKLILLLASLHSNFNDRFFVIHFVVDLVKDV